MRMETNQNSMLLGDTTPLSLLIHRWQLAAQLGHCQGVGEGTLGDPQCLTEYSTAEQLCCECKICENDMKFFFKINFRNYCTFFICNRADLFLHTVPKSLTFLIFCVWLVNDPAGPKHVEGLLKKVRGVSQEQCTLVGFCLYVKCKAIPLQTWAGPEGSKRLRLPDFKTFGTWRW